MNAIEQRFATEASSFRKVEQEGREGDIRFTSWQHTEGAWQKPTLFIPGLGVSAQTYDGTLRELFESGRDIIFFNYNLESERPSATDSKSDYGGIDLQISSMEKALKRLGVGVVEITAHSTGALYALLLARNDPEKRNVFLHAPIGLMSQDSRENLMSRATHQVFADTRALLFRTDWRGKVFLMEALSDWIVYVWTRPHTVLGDMGKIAKVDLVPVIEHITSHKGHVAVAFFEDDHVFPMERIKPEAYTAASLSMGVKGGHNTIGMASKKIAGLIDVVLSQMKSA